MSEDFEYVVQPKRKQRVAFGSTRERDTSFLRSKFDRTSVLHTPELFPNISPVSYHLERRRPQQPGGTWTKVARFKRITSDGPPPNAYAFQGFPIPSKKSEAPFNSNTPRDSSCFLGNSSPGPGTYNPKIEFLHSLRHYQKFGRNKIEVKASEDVNDLHRKCDLCHKSPTESGEPFWKKAIKDKDPPSIMCCNCMKNLQKDALTDLKKKSVINAYKLVCECPYYKRHAGIHNGQVRASWKEDKKLPKEARFDKFLLKTTQKEKDRTIHERAYKDHLGEYIINSEEFDVFPVYDAKKFFLGGQPGQFFSVNRCFGNVLCCHLQGWKMATEDIAETSVYTKELTWLSNREEFLIKKSVRTTCSSFTMI